MPDEDDLSTRIAAYLAYAQALSRGAIESRLDFLRKSGALEPAEFEKLVEEVRGRCREAQSRLGQDIGGALRGVSGSIFEVLDLPSRGEVEALRRELDELKSRVDSSGPPASPPAPHEGDRHLFAGDREKEPVP